MTRKTGMLVLAAALSIGSSMSAGAQVPPHPGGGKAAPAARPAAPHVAAPRIAAPPPRMAAPHISAPHVSAPPPRMAAPRISAPHVAAPRSAPAPRMASPRISAPARVANPHVNAQRMAGPRHSPAAVNRTPGAINHTAQQRQFREQRALRQQAQPAAQTNLQAQSQSRLTTRQQLRTERNLRRTEDRELRRLPASQRAQRREEIRNAREQRALSRQQVVQPGAAQTRTNAQTLRANRRNGVARVTPDVARQGRFASRFAQQAGGVTRDRFWHLAAHRAWRQGHRAAFVAWYGPIFWPYAYSDVFDYTFWPYGYDDGYWAYAYDDFFDGIFWGGAGPPPDYAYAAPSIGGGASAPRATYASVQELCRQPSSGITAWPFADIERKVGLTGDQKKLLDDVRSASEDAAAAFKASCPEENAFPLTPPGRLAAMTARLEATLQTVQTVRPALESFYDSLSDEQKERFNEIGPKNTATNAEASVASQAADTCKQPKQGLSNLPIEKIEDALNPTDAQEAELNRLQEATNKAVSILQAACPDETPITPPGRLAAMEKRLQAMIDAANTVKPSLESFYASLTNEQKARFNRIGRQLSQNNG